MIQINMKEDRDSNESFFMEKLSEDTKVVLKNIIKNQNILTTINDYDTVYIDI